MEVKYITKTHAPHGYESIEHLMAYIARVSNPASESDKKLMAPQRLLFYCLEHEHWSVFEMADLTVEITTSRAISAQIMRHRSFTFQEFSQRYSTVQSVEKYVARRQDDKNRQNSLDNLSEDDREWFEWAQKYIRTETQRLYSKALDRGIAKECARFLLPMAATTTLYMKGSVRSWIHYLKLRTEHGTQQEHKEIALEILKVFKAHFPITSKALGWI